MGTEITVENICAACGKTGCDEPCEKWYKVLEGKRVTFAELAEE